MTSGSPPRLRVLIVDDEPLARQRIADMVVRDGCDVVGEAENGATAIESIRTLQPDLVFLDVQMPGKTGLDVVREVGVDRMPPTIFVTAYDQHALAAFDVAALDYLVKPFDDDRFEQSLERAKRIIAMKGAEQLRDQLMAVLQGQAGQVGATAPSGSHEYADRIPVEMKGKVKVIPAAEVEYITSDGPYAELHTADRMYVIRESMQSLEEKLDPNAFLRVHRSVIVRLDRIDTLHKGAGGDYEVQIKSGRRLRVSRSRIGALEKKLGL